MESPKVLIEPHVDNKISYDAEKGVMVISHNGFEMKQVKTEKEFKSFMKAYNKSLLKNTTH
jgi:hypothetical protein